MNGAAMDGLVRAARVAFRGAWRIFREHGGIDGRVFDILPDSSDEAP